MMRNNVVNYYGSIFSTVIRCVPKTGTAELDDKNPNCWIVGFSEDESTPRMRSPCACRRGTSGLYTAR